MAMVLISVQRGEPRRDKKGKLPVDLGVKLDWITASCLWGIDSGDTD